MAKLTYRDLERVAPRVELWGLEFLDGVPIEVDTVPRKARTNRFFVVEEEPAELEAADLDASDKAAEWAVGKAKLWAELETRGIAFDRRLGLAKLQALLDEAPAPRPAPMTVAEPASAPVALAQDAPRGDAP